MLWYSGRSLPLPAYSVVATLNCVTCLPDASARISGSRVRRPAMRTLFTVHRSFTRSTDGSRADPACGGGPNLRVGAYRPVTRHFAGAYGLSRARRAVTDPQPGTSVPIRCADASDHRP